MAKSIVAHHYWGSPGGGQLVSASAAYALDSMGLEPILTGTFRFDPSKYVDWYGIDISRYRVYTLFSTNIRAFGLWSRLYVWRPALKALRENSDVEVLFTDEEAYRPIAEVKNSLKFKIIEYIHFPFEVVVDPRFRGSGLAYGEDPYVMERYGRFPMNMYWWVFVKMLPRYMRRNPFEDADLVLTNSRWTAGVAKMVYGEEPIVLNPPIPPNMALVAKPRPFEERANIIIMLGRFSEEKRYHWVVSQLMPRLTGELKDVKLVIFGGATTRSQLNYVNRVSEMAHKAGLRVKVLEDENALKHIGEAQVILRLNAPRSEINEAMDNAKVFLHATINEHWGIAVAEAMTRGLPIVVHRSGGTWSDLANSGEVGLGYDSVDEASEALARLITDKGLWDSLSRRSLERARDIGFSNFVNRLRELASRLI